MATTTSQEFSIEALKPGDEALSWIFSGMHHPLPVTPMTQTFLLPAFSHGMSAGSQRLRSPLSEIHWRAANGWVYIAAGSDLASLPPAEQEQRLLDHARIQAELAARALDRWHNIYAPRVEADCAAIRAYDYRTTPLPRLAAYVSELREIFADHWNIHAHITSPTQNRTFELLDLLKDRLGDEGEAIGHSLLQGFPNRSLESGQTLWALSRWLRDDQPLRAALDGAALDDGRLQLTGSPAATEFNDRWAGFLETYGWRSGRFELADPSWLEDQSQPLTQLRNFVALDDAQDPYRHQLEQAEKRQALVPTVEARLNADDLPRFRTLLQAAQQYTPILEDHNFTIDQGSTTTMRYALTQLGQRLVDSGQIPTVDAIFFLTFDDLRDIAAGSTSDYTTTIRERRLELKHQQGLEPPASLGPPLPPELAQHRAFSDFLGIQDTAKPTETLLTGIACSAGVAEGPAKVALTLDETDKIEPGDILVCAMTMPAWTPLFGTVAAVVADNGGALSHCAIVAREYGIPCVSGTRVATKQIRDGQRLRVDGKAGTVEILDP